METIKKRVAAVVLAAAATLATSGCSASQSTMAITYDNGSPMTVEGAFGEITCSDVEAKGTSVEPTLASFAVHFDESRSDYRANARVFDERLVLFKADAVSTVRDGDTLTVAGEGTVQIAERASGDDSTSDEAFDIDNAQETNGSLEARLVCPN